MVDGYEKSINREKLKKKIILMVILYVFIFLFAWGLCTFLVAFIDLKTKFEINQVTNYIFRPVTLILASVVELIAIGYYIVVLLFKDNHKKPGARRSSSNLYDDARFLSKKELDKEYGVCIDGKKYSPVFYRRAWDADVNGLIINSGIAKNGDYYFHRTDGVHSIVVGTTGTGKTKFMLIPTVLMMAHSKNKPSMIVIDIKGEILEKTYNTLKQYNYDVHVLDFRKPSVSEKYNPLNIIIEYYDLYQKDNYKYSTYKYRYEAEINKLAELIVPSDKGGDTFWATAGQGIFKAIVNAMLEDYEASKKPDSKVVFDKKQFTFATISEINTLSSKEFYHYFYDRSLNSRARKLAQANILSNYEKDGTMNKMLLSIFSTYTTEFEKFVDHASQDLTIRSDFDPTKIKKQKSALFLLLPDEDRGKYALASLMINQIYSLLVYESQKAGVGKDKREVHLILDEFANLPKLKEIDNWLSVGRERKLYLSIFIQAISQLEDKYGKDFAKTIIQNCNMKIILGLGESGSIDYFKHLFGTYTIVSSSASLGYRDKSSSESQSLAKAELITSTEFMNMEPGEIFFLELKKHPGHTNIIPIFDERFVNILNLKIYDLELRDRKDLTEQERQEYVYRPTIEIEDEKKPKVIKSRGGSESEEEERVVVKYRSDDKPIIEEGEAPKEDKNKPKDSKEKMFDEDGVLIEDSKGDDIVTQEDIDSMPDASLDDLLKAVEGDIDNLDGDKGEK